MTKNILQTFILRKKQMSKKTSIVLLMVFLISCSKAEPTVDSVTTLNPTAIADPTLSAMYYDSQAASDGLLELEIQLNEDTCYALTSHILVHFVFRNIYSESITIPVFKQDGTGLKPILTSRTLYFYYNPEVPRDYSPSTLAKLVTLSVGEVYEGVYVYRVPDFLWVYSSGESLQVSTLTTGKYLLKFIFENHFDYDLDAWKGRIASNQIEICVVK